MNSTIQRGADTPIKRQARPGSSYVARTVSTGVTLSKSTAQIHNTN